MLDPKAPRSKLVAVGDVRLCVDRDGENAPGRALGCPPPPLPPPPPPSRDAAAEPAAEDAKFDPENGVVVRERGDDRGWLLDAAGGCDDDVVDPA